VPVSRRPCHARAAQWPPLCKNRASEHSYYSLVRRIPSLRRACGNAAFPRQQVLCKASHFAFWRRTSGWPTWGWCFGCDYSSFGLGDLVRCFTVFISGMKTSSPDLFSIAVADDFLFGLPSPVETFPTIACPPD